MLIRHNEDDLDRMFRQKLYNVEEETPLHLWEGIRQQNTRKRKTFVWWWVLPTAILTMSAVVYLLHGDHSKSNAIAQIATDKKTQATIVFNSEKSETISSGSTKGEEGLKESENPPSAERVRELEAEPKFDIINYFNSNNEVPINKTLELSNSNSESKESYVSPDFDEIAVQEPDLGVSGLDSIVTKPQTLLSQVLQESIEQDVFSGGLPFIGPTEDKVPLRWSMALYYGLAQPLRLRQPASQEYAYNQFVDRTQLGLSHSAGLMIGYSLPWHVQISAGIEYQRFHERHDWIDSTLVQKKTYVFDYDTTSTFTGTTITQYVIDSAETNEWKTQSNSRINRYSSINIPVLLSWIYPFKKYSLGLEVGPVFRIQSIYNGEFVFANWQSLPPTTNIWTEAGDASSSVLISKSYEVPISQVYRSWRTDLHLGIHQSYLITSKVAASLSLQTRFMMNEPRTANETAHRIIQPGVRVGLSYFIK